MASHCLSCPSFSFASLPTGRKLGVGPSLVGAQLACPPTRLWFKREHSRSHMRYKLRSWRARELGALVCRHTGHRLTTKAAKRLCPFCRPLGASLSAHNWAQTFLPTNQALLSPQGVHPPPPKRNSRRPVAYRCLRAGPVADFARGRFSLTTQPKLYFI